MRAQGAERTHTMKGLSRRLGRRPALCPGCWVLQRDGVLLHCMRPQIHLGSDWACKITATPVNPLLPEGFSLHILPVDYHHCQSWLLHSSCCPHSGSGANLSRLHGGRKLSHTAQRSQAAAHQSPSLLPSVETAINGCCCSPFCQSFPRGAFKQYPDLQMFRTRSESPLLGNSSSGQNRQWRFPCGPTRVALCRCFLWAKPGQSVAFTVQKETFSSRLQCETQALSS